MRRYRFGRIAAFLAVGYVAVVVVAGVIALITGDPGLLRQLVVGDGWQHLIPFAWWVEILVIACGVLQAWVYWQVLRGRLTGEPAGGGRSVGLLRAALYLSVACALLFILPLPYQWWLGLPGDLIQFAIVCLFFMVLRGALPRWLRLLGLVAGLLDAALQTFATVAFGVDLFPLAGFLQFVGELPVGDALHLMWLIPVLVGQARDPRWSRATVRMGAIAAALSFLSPGSFGSFSFGGVVDYVLVLFMLTGVLHVIGLAWAARSAHELGGPPAVPSAETSPRAAARAPRRPCALAALAVVPPLIPAAVNLAHGTPLWIGPRSVFERYFQEYTAIPATLLWIAVDALVGVGAPAVLVGIAVVRRTKGLLRGTMAVLLAAAVAGVVTVLTTESGPDIWGIPEYAEERLRYYPAGLLPRGQDGGPEFGISPLWYSVALAVSALLLFLLYTEPPAVRRPYHMLAAGLVLSLALLFLPAAAQVRGPFTTAKDCSPREYSIKEDEPLTGTRAFVCAVRTNDALEFADAIPDLALVEYGRRLCDVYTRNDPRELDRVRSVHGVDVARMAYVLADICPAADAKIKAQQAAQDREFEEFQAEEQRKCDATPRHRPLIRPVKAVRLKEPEWPEVGLELYEGEGDPTGDGVYEKSGDNGLVGAGPGHLFVQTHSDYHMCVTLETYARRPPVETKGWEHVVEVGYDSPTGRMVLMDGLSGTTLPDISLNGRKGHYRIRVHFAWFPWKGEKYGTQRLLIMAYPGPGDKVITYRKPAKRR
ncbi:hypothetical protein AB0K60_20075 [Thermopolyspora sp. NPDC052614]|uniref:hypothetical protein n=1 Tax=Thermopolyspora sp. NPDC052614 TaxID=3155682 RepID=UPI003444C1F1